MYKTQNQKEQTTKLATFGFCDLGVCLEFWSLAFGF